MQVVAVVRQIIRLVALEDREVAELAVVIVDQRPAPPAQLIPVAAVAAHSLLPSAILTVYPKFPD